MRRVLLAIVIVIVTSATARAQFADTPTDHWALDALAELAAKGILEGYPDGTFKGDRALTRYEMAMIGARLLARIEAIKIPPPVPPEILRRIRDLEAEVDAMKRVINSQQLALGDQAAGIGGVRMIVQDHIIKLRDLEAELQKIRDALGVDRERR